MKDVACPICGSGNHRLYVWASSHYGPEKLRVTQCVDCGMIFTNPQSCTYRDEVKHRGVLERHFADVGIHKSRCIASFQLSLMARYAPGRRVLDFGCGNGAFVYEAVAQGWQAVGIDINVGLVEAASRYWGMNVLRNIDLDEFIAEHPPPFDAIISNQVFEHLQKPMQVARCLISLLKLGGILYIDVPNAGQMAEWRSRGSTLDPTAHWNHFTQHTLKDLILRIGCRVVFCSAAPSLMSIYHRLGFGKLSNKLGFWSRRLLPPIGTGVSVIGKRIS